MDDPPYTSPDEDPFNVQPLLKQPRRRRSSMLDKWIKDQQALPSDAHDETLRAKNDSRLSPYLAYPELGMPSSVAPHNDVSTLHSYDLVEDDDIPQMTQPASELPSTPTASGSRKGSKSRTPSSFRHFNLPFRASYPAAPPSPTGTNNTPSRPLSRLSLFPRSPRHSSSTVTTATTPQHVRSSSLSTTNTSVYDQSPKVSATSPPKWRPSVLGHFSQSSIAQSSILPSDSSYTPSRPSVSSGDTSNTNTSRALTTPELSIPPSPSKLSLFSSIRTRNRSSGSLFKPQNSVASSSSIWHPRAITEDFSPNGSDCITGSTSTLPRRAPFAPKPGSHLSNMSNEDELDGHLSSRPNKRDSLRGLAIMTAGGTLSRAAFSPLSSRNQKKKKKLVISGVGVNEVRKFEGVKRWCESFGEIRQISRAPNGDLHVDFRRADVADTVCRVRAKVFIAGVGSVQLSWYTGDKR
jgi:hypothetical protein